MEFKFNRNSPKWKNVKSVNDWIDCFRNSKNDEEGRSALTLAKFCSNASIEKQIKDMITPVISSADLYLDSAYPEKSSRFDDFSKQRIHDLGIYGHTSDNKSVFIGVEAKVNETYSSTLSATYKKACSKLENGINTDVPQRIEQLIIKYFPNITIESSVRYQLLYAIAGTLCENKDYNILLFLTFKTDKYVEKSAKRNKQDLQDLLQYITSEVIFEGCYKCQIADQTLYIVERMI